MWAGAEPAAPFQFAPSLYGPSTADDALPAGVCGSFQLGSPAGGGGPLAGLRAAGPPRCIAPNPSLDPLHNALLRPGEGGTPAQQLAYLRASQPTLHLPAGALTELLQQDAASAAWGGSRRGNALATAAGRGDRVVLCHPHGPLCDSVRLTSVQPQQQQPQQQQPQQQPPPLRAVAATTAACDGSVRQVAACGCCGDDAALSVAVRTDYTVQVWRADLGRPRASLRPAVRRMFDAALLDCALDDDGCERRPSLCPLPQRVRATREIDNQPWTGGRRRLVIALTADGSLHSVAVGARTGADGWATVGPGGQGRHATCRWEFVTRAVQPRTFLTAGARTFGLFDWRAKRIEDLLSPSTTREVAAHDPWPAPTTALCHHSDPNSPHLFARATTVRV